ncbi:hypothetical protein BH23VER1_BH23VER1_18400 [soil metagenome]
MSVRKEKLKIVGYHALLVALAVLKTTTRPTASLLYGAFDLREHDRLLAEYAALHRRGLVAPKQRGATDSAPLWELTKAGQRALDGGRSFEARWERPWDGSWCLFSYDTPTGDFALRQRLRRWLTRNGFGWLQQSVWIAPEAPSDFSALMARAGLDPANGAAFSARSLGNPDPATIVARAWDFARISRAQESYIRFATAHAKKISSSRNPPSALAALAPSDRELWRAAFVHDPLLPRPLWPDNYRGPDATAARHLLVTSATK